ncbi:hypothetical protein ESCO_000902 [Escovopsis weberi]|uniref:Uncharacterized protein n=1 Tax=Escovopsis weberi TaxID=150374 RepID=A0A0M8N2A8_ESCWE|nr:hypothetical protein ESCO_000902 [Escovopsis weberi]
MQRPATPTAPRPPRDSPRPARATQLPPEVLLLVVEASAPANPLLIAAPSHPAARTLLALSRTCRATRVPAARLLRERCAHVGSGGRLARVLECMAASAAVEDGAATEEEEDEDDDAAAAALGSLAPIMPLRHMTSLYLEPFAEKERLGEAGTAAAVGGLLAQVGGTLRRLVVRMPFGPRGEGGEEEEEVEEEQEEEEEEVVVVVRAKRLLRDGLARLGALEEFVCLGSYPTLGCPGGPGEAADPVWRQWPLLERLVLFGAPVRSGWLWREMAEVPRLESVVLACPERPRGGGGAGGVNIKRELLGAWRGMRMEAETETETGMGMGMKVTVVDLAYEMEGLVDREGWEAMDPGGRVRVGEVEVPLSFYGDEERVEAVTAWVRRGALDGSIWGW